MSHSSFRLEEVVSFPQPLSPGVLYWSPRFAVTAHKCACGCGNDVVLGLNPAQWQLMKHADGTASLSPSIDNSSFPCRSHYWIRHGKVDWCGQLTIDEAQEARARDRRARDSYFSTLNAQQRPRSRLWTWVKSLFRLDSSK